MRGPHSQATRDRIAMTLRGRKLDPAVIAKISAANLGQKRSEETRARISAALKGKRKSEEHCRNMSLANKGKKTTPETRAAMRRGWAAKTYEQKLAASAAGRKAANPSKHKGAHNARW